MYRIFRDIVQYESPAHILLKVGYWIIDMYPISAVVLFMCLTWTASMMLQRLIDDLPTTTISSNMEMSPQMIKWKHNYQLISSFIEKINHFFGAILLTFISRQLFYFIAYIYLLVMLLQRESLELGTLFVFYLIKHVTYVFCITSVSHRIKKKV